MNNPAEIDQNASASQPIRPWSSLLIRDYRLLWAASILNALAVQVRNVASAYQVYELTGSPFQLGLTGFLQALPFVVFGLFAGAVADAFNRKTLVVLSAGLQLVPCVALAFLTSTGAIRIWHIYLLSLLGAFLEVFNWPARAAMIPRMVPQALLMNAVTMNSMII